MQRLIRSFNTLTDALKETLQEQYPDGVDSSHIKSIPTATGDTLRVIELKTHDALYLIKINSESREEIDQYLDQDDSGGGGSDDDDDDTAMEGAETPDLEGDTSDDDEEDADDDAPTDDSEGDDDDDEK
ncbi:MAG: hypothetical protein KBA60_06480 [Flavobacteriales bacterium]|nr:hypothetical protein [Flavobacteriales bacterium]MBP6642000.1 hypothetical protein [Flavobacteriales bacterium]MBP7155635.1 hypothetical protein [Flavobacteriales bacterium]HQV75796.1 hypothetical protein [Flavobacteriales bacterium]HQW41440.1 hypothetical protein [Flavobacteriales bacterium]